MGAAKDIIAEKEKELKTACQAAAKEIGKNIHDDFRTAIRNFYNDWPAKSRGYNLELIDYGVHGKKVYHKTIGKKYLCGVYVGPEYMGGNPYVKSHGWDFVTPSLVFSLSYISGIHGFTDWMVASHNAGLVPGDEGYWNPGTIPKTSTPPDVEMETAFEKYTYDYVKSVVNSYM